MYSISEKIYIFIKYHNHIVPLKWVLVKDFSILIFIIEKEQPVNTVSAPNC